MLLNFKNNIESIRISKNKRYNTKFSFNKFKPITSKFRLYKRTYLFHVPSTWNIITLKNNKNFTSLFIYNHNYYYMLPGVSIYNDIYYDRNSRTLVSTSLISNSNVNLFKTFFKKTFSLMNVPTFRKIKFKGKGYYIYKNKRNTVAPQFNYAHRLYIYSFFSSMKFLSKTSVIIFGYYLEDIKLIALNIKKQRPINIFTGRGVRFNKQIVYKKTGKVSSYR